MAVALAASLLHCSRAKTSEKIAADPATQRTTQSGTVVGFKGTYGDQVWRGIPYAKPPVGPLRWRAPQPPDAWTGTREALAFASACTQYGSEFSGIPDAKAGVPVGSEDCLYMNIFAPSFTPGAVPSGDQRLPVMVWIHGGGNTVGATNFFNGGNLATSENVVVVTISYRLGPFGWFRHASLRGEGTTESDRSGNFGTLDVVRALEWVRDNISAFGGNPNNVTVFGESAGARNVYTMVQTPKATGLFHRAIVQSGGLWTNTITQAENFTDDTEPGQMNSSNEVLATLLVQDETVADRAAAKARIAGMSAVDTERYLRGKSNLEILQAYKPEPGLGMIQLPQVFSDGAVLPTDEPIQRFAQPGGYNQVPVMVGTNRDENKLFMFGDPNLVRRYLWIFPRVRNPEQYNIVAEYQAKMWKATGADEPAAAMHAGKGPDVFVYRFDWDEEPTLLGADLSMMLGASHAFEIPFVFGHFDMGRDGNLIWTDENEPGRKTLSDQMMSYWAQFAYTGAPGRGRDGKLPEWTAWNDDSATSPKFMVFDTAAGGGVRMAPERVTRETVLAEVDDDARLAGQKDKCHVYRILATWSGALTKEQYATAGKKGCAEYPYDAFPWEG